MRARRGFPHRVPESGLSCKDFGSTQRASGSRIEWRAKFTPGYIPALRPQDSQDTNAFAVYRKYDSEHIGFAAEMKLPQLNTAFRVLPRERTSFRVIRKGCRSFLKAR
jgi:hypothetical protein